MCTIPGIISVTYFIISNYPNRQGKCEFVAVKYRNLILPALVSVITLKIYLKCFFPSFSGGDGLKIPVLAFDSFSFHNTQNCLFYNVFRFVHELNKYEIFTQIRKKTETDVMVRYWIQDTLGGYQMESRDYFVSRSDVIRSDFKP